MPTGNNYSVPPSVRACLLSTEDEAARSACLVQDNCFDSVLSLDFTALDAATGRMLWQTPDPLVGTSDVAAVTTAHGVVFGCTIAPQGHMYALSRRHSSRPFQPSAPRGKPLSRARLME